MKKKATLMLIALVLVGQVVYFMWSSETFIMLMLRSLAIVFIVKLLGDFLGKFVFNISNYNWMYLRDYINNSFVPKSVLYFGFCMLWYLPIGLTLYFRRTPSILMHIYAGGILPTLFYYSLNLGDLSNDEVDEKRLRRKL